MRRRGRPLTEEEKHLWRQVTESVTPLHEAFELPPEITEFSPASPVVSIAPSVHSSRKVTALPGQLDKPTVRRIKARRLPVEATLDLHGMTRDAAQQALTRFILLAGERGQRTVLVITGKGRTEMGKIRKEFPHWLELPPLRSLVIGFHVAHRQDGGEGAFYVRIRQYSRF